MGAMCKFDFPIGRLRGVGEYVLYVVNAAQGTKGLRVKVYTTPAVGTPDIVHCAPSPWLVLHPSISVSYCSSFQARGLEVSQFQPCWILLF